MHIAGRTYLRNGLGYLVGHFQRMLKREDQLIKREYLHAINTTTTTTTASIVSFTKAWDTEVKI